jgi:hypothetical protein
MNLKKLNIISGSTIGFLAGLTIVLTLNYLGIIYDPLSATLIIALPATLGLITSFSIF